MKIIKKISLIIAAVSMILVVSGCGNKTEGQSLNNFNIKYEAEKTVDKVIYKVGNYEGDITPMHEDKKVKKGYVDNVVLDEEEFNLSIEVIDNGETVYKLEDSKIDLTNGKRAEVEIVEGADGKLEAKVVNK